MITKLTNKNKNENFNNNINKINNKSMTMSGSNFGKIMSKKAFIEMEKII